MTTATLCHLLSAKTRGTVSTTFTAKFDEVVSYEVDDEEVDDEAVEDGKNEDDTVEECKDDGSRRIVEDEVDDVEVCSCAPNFAR